MAADLKEIRRGLIGLVIMGLRALMGIFGRVRVATFVAKGPKPVALIRTTGDEGGSEAARAGRVGRGCRGDPGAEAGRWAAVWGRGAVAGRDWILARILSWMVERTRMDNLQKSRE